MSLKRKATAAAVPSPEPKSRQPKGGKSATGKRKVEEDDEEVEDKPSAKKAAAGKRSSASGEEKSKPAKEASRRASSSGSVTGGSAVKGKKGFSKKVVVEEEDDDEEEEEDEEKPVPKSTKKPARASVGKKGTAAVQPRVSDGDKGVNVIPLEEQRGTSHRQVTSVATATSEDEMVGLWQQYWTALDMCMSTVTPLFLALVLGLYAFSAVTKSQTVASIGLVYVFVFLIIMGSYFFAIVPFILASNAITSLVSPGSTTMYRDFVRLGLLLVTIGGIVATIKYGLPKL